MNIEWAIEQLDDFIKATAVTYVPSPPSSIGFHSYKTAVSEDEIVKRAQVVEQILDRVVPTWRTDVQKKDRQKWSVHYEASIRAREELVRAEEVRENLGENAPELSAAKLHPWIWEGAKSLWQSGHYREAVGGAIRKLNAETQNKVGRRDVSETNLFKQAFSMDQPKADATRLRRMKDDGSDTYKSVQRGAMTFAEGVFAGIRNPLSHEAEQELSEQEALEYLAALSVLARWVDQSDVEAAS
ncbi:TIGR02391 family protein [Nocardia farcinica]|uniref:TIGR02391 family protein n=1 Tax=Mycobacteriales TaxID=85007 RepID=UPI00092AA166|nr:MULTISPECIES: TIGR02391 family protein [Mycobacteriales]MBF6421097.1 TIGR02391 family protein [Nocardia farcinica]MBF6432754.1 TIGR02391 family protein [Nocardia farcinica]MBF6503332.1 TIGR02391 family protein [Nocardia farcinica]SHY17416.1 TIGR02391 family protein [Mycobacteroides abscessus subsp. abscessus]